MAGKASPETKFFHQMAEPLSCFLDMKAPQRRTGKVKKQMVAILFRMPLNGNTVRSAPEFIQLAYQGVKENGERSVELKKELEGIDIEVFELPNKRQKKIYSFDAAHLENIYVKEIKSGKGDPSIVLTFSSTFPLPDLGLFRFMHDHYKSEVFLRFDSTQASLLDLPDVKADKVDKNQPELPGTKAEGGEEAEGEEAGTSEEAASFE